MPFPIAAAAGLGLGLLQTGISALAGSNLPEPKKFSVSPELRSAYNMSRKRADEGYSAAERANFEQMLARQGSSAKRMFQNAGLAGAGSAAANIMNIDALNTFAAKETDIRRQNFGQFADMAGQVQRVGDMEVNRFNQALGQEQQALGQGMQSGISNMFGAVNSFQNFNQKNKALDIWQGMGQGGSQSPFGGPQAPIGSSNGGGFGQGGQQNTYGFDPSFQGGGMGAFTPQNQPPQGGQFTPFWNK